MTLSFDYILQNEEKQQMKRLLNYIRENGYVIQYMAAHKLYTKPISFFTTDDINDEAVLTLLYFVDKFLKEKGQPNFVKDLDRLLLRWPDHESFWSNEQAKDALVGTEAFLKGLYWVLYKGEKVFIDDNAIDCYDGDPVRNIVGIDGMTFNGLVTGTIAKGKISLPPLENSKSGIVDTSNEVFKSLAQTVMRFRNLEVHYKDEDKDAVDVEDTYFKNTNDDSKLFFIRMDIIVLLMLATQYQYDNLCKKVSHIIPSLGNNTNGNVENDALQLINERYIPGLLFRQDDIISEAFNFFSSSRSEHIGIDSINVMMCPVNFSTDDSVNYLEDENSDVEISAEQQEDPFCLLDRTDLDRIFLGGASGSGKSTIVAKLIKELCNRWISDTSDQAVLPIRINIRQYDLSAGAVGSYMVKAVANSMMDSYLVKADEDSLGRFMRHLREQGRLMVFFDGLNEAGKNTGYVLDEIIRYCNSAEFSNCRCVVTSRIVELGEKHLGRFASFSAYELCPLSAQLVKEQIKRASSFLPTQNVWERICQSPKLQDIASNPQQLKLLLELLGRSKENYIVPNKTILFEQVAERLMNLKYGEEAPDKLSTFNQIICCAAGLMMEQSEPIDVEWVKDHCSRQFHGTPSNIYEMMRSAKEFGILNSVQPYVTFKHDSWKEFFQAVYVKSLWLIADDQTRREQIIALRKILQGDDEDRLLLGTDLICSVYELLDRDMLDKRRVRERMLLSDITNFLLSPSDNEPAKIILEKDDNEGLKIQFTDNTYPQPDNILTVLAMAIAGMGYSPMPVTEIKNSYPSDPKTVVEGFIINQLLLYRQTHPNSQVEPHLNILKDLFATCALSGSERVLEELFHPYWMRIWLLHNQDFDLLMGNQAEHNDNWEQRTYENRVALTSESRVLVNCLISKAANKPVFAKLLMEERNELLRFGFIQSAAVVKHYIIRLFLNMTSQDLKETITYCRSKKTGSSIFGNHAALLLDDAESMKEMFIPEKKTEIPNSIVNQLLQHIGDSHIADFIWENPFLKTKRMLKALVRIGYEPLLRAIQRGAISDAEIEKLADDTPFEMLPAAYIESHYDTSVLLHMPNEDNPQGAYKANLSSLIVWSEPSRYHSSVCQAFIKELKATPLLATKEVWQFYERHNKASLYTDFYANLHPENRKDAWCPSVDVCHVLSVSKTSILLFSPLKGYTSGGSLQDGLRRIANVGQKVSWGELVIMEQDGTMTPFSLQEESFYGFREGIVSGKTGRDYFIRNPEYKEDFYYYDRNGQYEEMEKGEKVVFFPSVNLLYDGRVKPMAHHLKLIREQERSGILERKNLEIVSDQKAYVLKIRDLENGDIVTATIILGYTSPTSLLYIENLEIGGDVRFRNFAFGKKKCNIIIPNNKQ